MECEKGELEMQHFLIVSMLFLGAYNLTKTEDIEKGGNWKTNLVRAAISLFCFSSAVSVIKSKEG